MVYACSFLRYSIWANSNVVHVRVAFNEGVSVIAMAPRKASLIRGSAVICASDSLISDQWVQARIRNALENRVRHYLHDISEEIKQKIVWKAALHGRVLLATLSCFPRILQIDQRRNYKWYVFSKQREKIRLKYRILWSQINVGRVQCVSPVKKDSPCYTFTQRRCYLYSRAARLPTW